MFDIATTSNLAVADQGTLMPILDPSTGMPVRGDNDEVQGIILRSRLSRAGQTFQRQSAERRLEMSRRGQDTSVDTLEAETTDLLVACTVGWTFDTLDGQPFEYSEANARKLWSDPRFRGLRERANVWIGNEANFTKR